MGRRLRRLDILSVLVKHAEDQHQTPNNTFSIGVPHKKIGDCLRNGSQLSPTTILTYVSRYHADGLLKREMVNKRSLKVRLHGNAWTAVENAVKTHSVELDEEIPLRPWLNERFLGKQEPSSPSQEPLVPPPPPVPTPTVVPATNITICLELSPKLINLLGRLGLALSLIGEELQRQ